MKRIMMMVAVTVCLVDFARAQATIQASESFTNKQTYSKTESYTGIPDKMILESNHVVLFYPYQGTWQFSVVATSNGIPILLVVDDVKVESKTFTATEEEVDTAVGKETATSFCEKLERALIKLGIVALQPK